MIHNKGHFQISNYKKYSKEDIQMGLKVDFIFRRKNAKMKKKKTSN